MNWEAIGAIGEIVGAFAVFGSLIFVGIQFRQSSNQTLQMLYQQTVESFSSSSENSRVVVLGNQDPNALTPQERFQYGALLMNFLNAASLIWEQRKKGLIGESSYKRVLDVASFYYVQPGFQALMDGSLFEAPNSLELMNEAGYPMDMFLEIGRAHV